MADGDLVLSIKNPGRPTAEDFRLTLRPSATVRELKAALQERYPGNPAPATVTAIYAGRVLKDDNAVLSSFIVPAIAFVPTLIPVPQPVLPAYMTGDAAAQQQQQQQQQGAEGAAPAQQALPPGQVLMAAPMAVPYQLPYGVAVPQMPQQVFVQGAQLRHRRQQQQQAQQQQQHPGMLPHGLANMLRQQQLQHGALPPHLAEALRRHDAAVAAAAGAPAAAGAAAVAGRAVPGQAPRRPMLNVVVRLNMRALLQLLVLTVVVYQHCPPGRFLMLALVVGFFTSLIPGWNVNPDDAAAIAAAQAMFAAEEEEAAAAGIR
ncbi:hypothetical protein COHA_000080 [Chlorella ohadii]|uniref:Ubiquitin-like domain-containing protein n=1 Tax=Chlorella ohadii TaxID=2649997 RepID=A0AAD5E1I8_9CHLO|nr:hypothetical protein COHA_000080 [Chlorella ohadii]